MNISTILERCAKEFDEDTLVSAHASWTPKAIQDFIKSELIALLESQAKDLENAMSDTPGSDQWNSALRQAAAKLRALTQ